MRMRSSGGGGPLVAAVVRWEELLFPLLLFGSKNEDEPQVDVEEGEGEEEERFPKGHQPPPAFLSAPVAPVKSPPLPPPLRASVEGLRRGLRRGRPEGDEDVDGGIGAVDGRLCGGGDGEDDADGADSVERLFLCLCMTPASASTVAAAARSPATAGEGQSAGRGRRTRRRRRRRFVNRPSLSSSSPPLFFGPVHPKGRRLRSRKGPPASLISCRPHP